MEWEVRRWEDEREGREKKKVRGKIEDRDEDYGGDKSEMENKKVNHFFYNDWNTQDDLSWYNVKPKTWPNFSTKASVIILQQLPCNFILYV